MFESKIFEIIVYPESYDCSQIKTLCKHFEYIKDFAFVQHDKDEGKKEHYHIALQTHYTLSSERIAKDFGVNENAVEKAKSTRKTHKFDDVLLYLIHKNAPDKYQYSTDEVTASFDYASFIEKHRSKEAKSSRKIEIIEQIQMGYIREYNLHEHITAMEFVQFGTVIKSAFQYREKMLAGSERNMDVIFIQGKSGVGKTTFAKKIAQKRGLDYFISSSSNDILYGFASQPCCILDDVRGSVMTYSDWLKLLDNNTNSTVKARYNNKNLAEVNLLIITTPNTIDEFYNEIFDHEGESIIQLKRRCGTYIRMEKDYYYVSAWDKEKNCYTNEIRFCNDIAVEFKQAGNVTKNALAVLGLDESEAIAPQNNFVQLTDEQAKQIKLLFAE